MSTVYEVYGPHAVPFEKRPGGKIITSDSVYEFWQENSAFAGDKGCYVFGVRAGRGYTPGYVGRATVNFKQEVFTHHKLTRYHDFLSNYVTGTPVLFFVSAPIKRGATNISHITELEDFLIQVGQAANPELLNIQGTKEQEWGIRGVIRGGKGRVPADANEFKKLMKLDE